MKNFKSKNNPLPYILFFDVDGVLTNPSQKKIAQKGLLEQLAKRLEANQPIILNTGRSADFVIKNIFNPLENLIKNNNILKNLFAIGEKGAVNIYYAKTGKIITKVDSSISVPKNLQNQAQKLAEEKFSDVVFYDETKKTMISIEMINNFSIDEFKKRQKNLNKELLRLLKEKNLTSQYKIDPSIITTDLENKHVGKALGVQKALKWLTKRKIKTQKFITFGDSPADLEMAKELHKQKLPVEFVFVDKKELLAKKKINFPIIYTTKHLEAGTMEYLKKLKF